MSGSIRQRLTPVHSWIGLLLSWLLYFIILTGTLGYFDSELDQWMRPEVPIVASPRPAAEWLTLATQQLEKLAPEASHWSIDFPAGRYSFLTIYWEQGDQYVTKWLHPESGEIIPARDTAGGQTLYRMHWELRYMPLSMAYWVVSICCVVMLLAAITGTIIHRRIFADFFTFRPGKRIRSWLDMHNLLSVSTLPFQLMISYSGLAFFAFTYMALMVPAFYGSDPEKQDLFYHEVYGEAAHAYPSGNTAPMAELHPILQQAEEFWGLGEVRYISVDNRMDQNAQIKIAPVEGRRIHAEQTLVFDGVSGELRTVIGDEIPPARKFYEVVTGLHEALFATPLLRWLFFISGLMLAGVIATGCVMWYQNQCRKNKEPPLGTRLVLGLNIATLVGLPTAIGCYFLANRLLPIGLEGRADWEVHCLFLAWLALGAHAMARKGAQAWSEQFWLTCCVFVLLPLTNALTTERHLLSSLTNADWVFAAFDLTCLGVSLIAAICAYSLRCPPQTRVNPAITVTNQQSQGVT